MRSSDNSTRAPSPGQSAIALSPPLRAALPQIRQSDPTTHGIVLPCGDALPVMGPTEKGDALDPARRVAFQIPSQPSPPKRQSARLQSVAAARAAEAMAAAQSLPELASKAWSQAGPHVPQPRTASKLSRACFRSKIPIPRWAGWGSLWCYPLGAVLLSRV